MEDFRAADGLLYLGGHCMLHPVPDTCDWDRVRKATVRMHEETGKGEGTTDELSLLQAIAILVGWGATVRLCRRGVDVMETDDEPSADPPSERFVVPGAWSPKRMAGGGGDERARGGDHAYVVSGKALPSVFAPDVDWDVVTRGASCTRRFFVERAGAEGRKGEARLGLVVRTYCGGVLRDVEAHAQGVERCRGWTVHLDVHRTGEAVREEEEEGEEDASRASADLEAFAGVFLRSDRAAELCLSRGVRAFLDAMRPWRPLLKRMWTVVDDQHMIDLVCGPSPSELVHLTDVRGVLAATAETCPDIDMLGMAVLRRRRPNGCAHDAEWRAAAVAEHAVSGFRMLPTDSCRLRRLHDMGALDPEGEGGTCAHGLFVDEGPERTVAVPFDANADSITIALATMLPTSADAAGRRPVAERIHLPFGVLHCDDDCVGLLGSDVLRAYRASIDPEEGVFLVLDHDGRADEDDVSSVDVLSSASACLCPSRRDPEGLSRALPRLSERLRSGTDAVQACVREVQARRVCAEWTVEGIDAGNNLSPLGLSVALAIALRAWAGAATRVFVSGARSSVVGCWDRVEARFVLVDPCRTAFNGFDVASYLFRVDVPPDPVRPRAFLEVLRRTRWHTARVVSVNRALQTARVRFVLTGRVTTICLRQQAWRRVDRDARTDVSDILRRYVRRTEYLERRRGDRCKRGDEWSRNGDGGEGRREEGPVEVGEVVRG